MRETTIKIYPFDELSKEAKKNAIEHYRDSINDFAWSDEAMDSLKKFAEYFGSKLENWSIDFFAYSQSSVQFAEVEDVSEDELKQLIENMGSYDKKTLIGNGDCKFTGVCYDEDCADGAREAFYKDGIRAINTLLDAGFDAWLKATHKEAEYEQSDEAIAEKLIEDEIEFTVSGKVYRGI